MTGAPVVAPRNGGAVRQPGALAGQGARAAAAWAAAAQPLAVGQPVGGLPAAAGAAGQTGAVRAVAAITPPRRRPTETSTAPSTPARLRLGVAQVVCWQAGTLAIVLGTLSRIPLVLVLAVVAGAALIVPTAVPLRGVWMYRWMGRRLSYRMRKRSIALADATEDPRRALLTALEPHAVLGELTVDNETVATIAHPGGMTAVLELQPGDHTLFAPVARPVPSPMSLLPAAEPDQPPTSMQVIVQVEQPPLAGTGPSESYRRLTGGAVPMHRRCWLAVQVRRTPAAYHDGELRPALASAVKRARRRLRQEKLAARPLGTDDVLAAAAMAARLDAHLPGRAGVYGQRNSRELARETWAGWRSGATAQTAYRIVRWPTGQWTMDQLLLGVPAAAVTLSVAALREPADENEDVQLELVVRIAALGDEALRAADARVVELVRSAGGALERLDGRQRAAMVASLPFGGFIA